MSERQGTAEWANSSDIKEKFRFKDGDFWLGRSFDSEAIPLGYQDDKHICLISGSRGGKGTSIIINNLCLYPGSVVVLDPKGENASVTAARRGNGSKECKGMGQTVHVLDPFGDAKISDEYRKCFNPLEALDPNNPEIAEEIVDEVDLIADSLVAIGKETKDPTWDKQGRKMIKGVILHVLTSKDYEGRRNLVTVRELIARGDWEGVEYLQKHGKEAPSPHALLWGKIQNNLAFDGIVSGIGTSFLNMIIQAPKQYEGALLAADTHTNFIDSPKMRQCLSKSDFKLSDLKIDEKGVSLFLCLPQRKMGTHYGWLRMMISLITTEMERIKKQPATGHRILMVLDEFAGLGQMKILENSAAQIAGFGVKLFFILQSIGQLKDIYKENWEIFLENSGLKIFFNIGGYGSQEYISKLLGDTEIIIESQNESVAEGKNEALSDSDGKTYKRKFPWIFRTDKRYSDGGNKTTGTSSNQSHGTNKTPQKRELIKPNEVEDRFASIKDKNHSEYPGLALVKISGVNPVVIKRVNYYEDDYFTGLYNNHPDHPLPSEICVPIPSIAHDTLMMLRKLHGDIYIHKWLINIGESVKKGENILEIGTQDGNPIVWKPGDRHGADDPFGDNVSVTLVAPESGTIVEHLVKSGQQLPIDQNIGLMNSTPQLILKGRDTYFFPPAYAYATQAVRKFIDNNVHHGGLLVGLGGAAIVVVAIVLWVLLFFLGEILGSIFGSSVESVVFNISRIICISLAIIGVLIYIGSLIHDKYLEITDYGKIYDIKFRTKAKPAGGIFILDWLIDDEWAEVKEKMEKASKRFYQ